VFPKLFTVSLPSFDFWGRTWGGPTTLHTYGFLLAVAFLVGLFVVSAQAKKAGLDHVRLTDMAVWLLIAGLLGAKLMLVIVDWRYYSANPRELLSIFQAGGVFYGGLLGGIAVAAYYVRRFRLPAWATADVMAPGLIVGQAIGRLGCFAAGCCYGKPASVPWAVTFTDAYAARQVGTPMDTALHPTQLYESLACFLIFFALLFLAPRKRFHGQVVLAYAVLYSVFRFAVEYVRGDPDRGTVFGGLLSTSQLVAVLLVLGALAVYPYLQRTHRVAAAAPPAPDA
jgi:phosphatidylglycerol:prolipoprotein diacylglycerol transferase